jgi:threonine dehydratase
MLPVKQKNNIIKRLSALKSSDAKSSLKNDYDACENHPLHVSESQSGLESAAFYANEIAKLNKQYEPLYDLVKVTPVERLDALSKRFSCDISIKREDLQDVKSFKIRGAYYHILNRITECQNGVIAASAGNHAQGVASAAKHLNLSATIVMPETTPSIKINGVKQLGGEVVLYGESFDQANQFAKSLADSLGLHFIPPFDDADVIQGQGSIALELTTQLSNVDVIFVPVGGGGLLAGLSQIATRVNPAIQIIGVEAEDSACMQLALCAGKPSALAVVDCFADGTAVKQAGKLTFDIVKANQHQLIAVSNDQICAAIKDIFNATRAIPEPSGALAVAGMKKWLEQNSAKIKEGQPLNICCILSGSNINFSQLKHIAERCDLGEKNEALLAVQIPEKAGSFLELSKHLTDLLVTEFNYRYQDPVSANIVISLQYNNCSHSLRRLIEQLTAKGYPVVNMTQDEVAKSHIRYMIGGAPLICTEEILIRCRFPEKVGALNHFLSKLGNQWNISLFHYRYQGNAIGEVLIGFRVAQIQKQLLFRFLKKTGYQFHDVTDSMGYQFFLTKGG